jgi:hypothetical protein
MYKPSAYLVVTYFPTYRRDYDTYFLRELVTKVRPDINSVEVHPKLSNNGYQLDGVLVGASLLWPVSFGLHLHLNQPFCFGPVFFTGEFLSINENTNNNNSKNGHNFWRVSIILSEEK